MARYQMSLDTTELISRCKAGDRLALDLLYKQYKSRLLNVCRQYTKENDVAEDLLHDAFVIILTSLDKLENPERLEPWMTAIARNVGYHYRHHLEKEQAALQQLSKEKPETTETGHIPDYDELQSLVSQLPQGYQRIFRLSAFEGLSHLEISQLLGITPHSSSSQLFHAKRMLRQLIRQSWVLILLLIAIPTVIWQFFIKEESQYELPAISETKPKSLPVSPVEKPDEQPVYASISKKQSSYPIRYQAETTTLPDSIPYQTQEEQTLPPTETTQTPEKETPKDTAVYHPFTQPTKDEPFTIKHVTTSHSWNISVAYNGQMGRGDDYLAEATIGKSSFYAASNTYVPTQFNNWMDYYTYLNYAPTVVRDAETRSMNYIAALNSATNSSMIEARHEHRLPVTLQILLNQQLTKRLSFETGLSYTRLSSTVTTGSPYAYIQEQQRLHYLGIPLRLGWSWYSKAHLSIYSSAGAMIEMPIKSKVSISHIADGINTFQKETPLDVPCQWSASFGLGLQYDFTPHLGVYLEPSLQYFFDDGSSIKTYRTEHPLEMTLPLGIRFHW